MSGYGYGDGSGSGSGSGSGYGDGSGSGSGYGDGSGSGSGSGSGYGYGDGSGSGSGSGSGYGDGSGSGSGSGDGDGSGYGDGYGYGYGDFAPSELAALADQLAPAGATLAFWRSDAEGKPCNGGSGQPVVKGMREKIKGPLALCTKNALHATLNPNNWKGERLWLVALRGEIASEGDKLGALDREILGEVVGWQ